MRVKQLTKHVLETYPETRDSDMELIFRVMEGKNIHLSDKQKQLIRDKMWSFESITRARREIQSDGQLLASEEVKQERDRLENDYRVKYQPKAVSWL